MEVSTLDIPQPTVEAQPKPLIPEIDPTRNSERLFTEASVDLEARLEQIDQDYIREQLAKALKLSGSDRELTYSSDIVAIADSFCLGEFDDYDQKIRIDLGNIDKESAAKKIDSRALLLEILTHEEIHAVTSFECKPVTRKDSEEEQRKISRLTRTANSQLGYQFDVVRGGLPDRQRFASFNEGVTEKLARQLVLDYLNNHPDFIPVEAVKRYKEVYENPDALKTYDPEVAFVDAMIAKLSVHSGVPESAVWEGIIQGQFSGQNFRDAELVELMDDVFGYGFSEDLSKAGWNFDVGHLMKYVRNIPPEKLDKFMKAYNLGEAAKSEVKE